MSIATGVEKSNLREDEIDSNPQGTTVLFSVTAIPTFPGNSPPVASADFWLFV